LGCVRSTTAGALQELLCRRPLEQPLHHRSPDLYGVALAIIRERMLEPLLGRNRVAAELGVSVRTLARAFAIHGTTFDRALWTSRLEAAYEALLSNRGSVSTTEVALRHGFVDSSYFARRFKTRFGATPSSLLNR
jgi:AraC family transcriptional activator of tynA and feaB